MNKYETVYSKKCHLLLILDRNVPKPSLKFFMLTTWILCKT